MMNLKPGQHVFRKPVLIDDPTDFLENPDYEVDTGAVIIRECDAGELGYVSLTTPLVGDRTKGCPCVYFFKTADTEFFETQRAAIEAALVEELAFAERLLQACDMWRKHLDKGEEHEGEKREGGHFQEGQGPFEERSE